MRGFFILFSIVVVSLYAEEVTDCTAVFEERKSELFKELDKIKEAKRANEAVRKASEELFNKKMQNVKAQQAKNSEILKKIQEERKNIENIKKANEELLASIEDIKNNKIGETYNKMKEGAAAAIMESLEYDEAANILFRLPPKKVSKIMAKMDPKVASAVTLLLVKGPPFDAKKDKK